MTDPAGGSPLNYASIPNDQFRGWHTGVLVFGIIAIIFGSCSGCLGICVPFALLMQTNTPGGMPPAQTNASIVSAMLLYLAIGSGLIWLGIGMVKSQRWVRPLVLIVGTLAICGGIFTVGITILMVPAMGNVARTSGQPRGAMMAGMIISVAFMFIITVIVPATYVLFFRSQSVKAMLEYYDLKQRWTDRCPVQVLGISVALAIFGLMAVFAMAVGKTQFFGRILEGVPAIGVQLITAAIALWLMRATFQMKLSGWWATMGFTILIGVSYIISGVFGDPAQMQMYSASGASNPGQTAVLQQIRSIGVWGRLAMSLPIYLGMVGYLIYARKFFVNKLIGAGR